MRHLWALKFPIALFLDVLSSKAYPSMLCVAADDIREYYSHDFEELAFMFSLFLDLSKNQG